MVDAASQWLKDYANYCTSDGNEKPEKWFQQFVCGIKVSDILIVCLTAMLILVAFAQAAVAYGQWRTYQHTLTANTTMERAYVTISHYPGSPETPFGALVFNYGKKPPEAMVRVKVMNHGRTPARIIAVSVAVKIARGTLPDRPDGLYAAPDPLKHFLVTGDWFNIQVEHTLTLEETEGVRNDASVLVIGYVDYEDMFRRGHRGGYARKLDRSNNLTISGVPAHHNYDEEHKAGSR